MSHNERFKLKVEPEDCKHSELYQVIEVEVMAVKKPIPLNPIQIDDVDSRYLSFPAAVCIHEQKDFVEYFRRKEPLVINLVHDKSIYGYVVKMKYMEAQDAKYVHFDKERLIYIKKI